MFFLESTIRGYLFAEFATFAETHMLLHLVATFAHLTWSGS